MGFLVTRGKAGTIICTDEVGTITFEIPRAGLVELDHQDVIDIEGGVDVAHIDLWLDQAVAAVRQSI